MVFFEPLKRDKTRKSSDTRLYTSLVFLLSTARSIFALFRFALPSLLYVYRFYQKVVTDGMAQKVAAFRGAFIKRFPGFANV